MTYTPLPPWEWPDPATDDPATGAYYTKWQISHAKAEIATRQDHTQALWASAQLLAAAISSLGTAMNRTYLSKPVTVTIVATWNLGNIALTPGSTFDLKATLPISALPGGSFSVHEGTLPPGVTLNATSGLLTVAPDALPVTRDGVILAYLEP